MFAPAYPVESPAPHLVQLVAPTPPPQLPTGHGTQGATRVALYVPVGHPSTKHQSNGRQPPQTIIHTSTQTKRTTKKKRRKKSPPHPQKQYDTKSNTESSCPSTQSQHPPPRVHCPALVAPNTPVNSPAGQVVHPLLPLTFWYVPGSHATHPGSTPYTASNEPALHGPAQVNNTKTKTAKVTKIKKTSRPQRPCHIIRNEQSQRFFINQKQKQPKKGKNKVA